MFIAYECGVLYRVSHRDLHGVISPLLVKIIIKFYFFIKIMGLSRHIGIVNLNVSLNHLKS